MWTAPHVAFDRWRLCYSGLIGATFSAVIYPIAYTKLDAVWPGVHLQAVMAKSLAEVATIGLLTNVMSLSTRALLAGHALDDVKKHVAQEMPSVTRNDAVVWIPYNMLAFSLIPTFVRPATTALMEAAWQTYLSLRAHDYEAARQQRRSTTALRRLSSRHKHVANALTGTASPPVEK